MTSPVDLELIITWPQAAVAIVIVVAILIVPQIVQMVQNSNIKAQFKNNGGSTLKDAVDRIERTLADHVEASEKRAKAVNKRFEKIEGFNARYRDDDH